MKTVQTSIGEFKIRLPTAGERRTAMQTLSTEQVKGQNIMSLLHAILPYCITRHPFKTGSVQSNLDELSILDYDLLVNALTEMLITEKRVMA